MSQKKPVFVQEMGGDKPLISECEQVTVPQLSAKLAKIYGKGEEVPIIARREGSRPVVRIGFFIYGMDNIDTIQQTFEGRFQVNLEWRPLLREAEAWAEDRVGFPLEWQPFLYFKNARSISKEQVQTYGDGMQIAMYQDASDQSLLFQKCIEYTIVFNEAFELHNFPFDVQPLRILFAAQWEYYPAINPYPALVPRCSDGPILFFEFANISTQWCFASGDAVYPDAGSAYDLSVCYVKVVREWRFYIVRVIGVNAIIVAFSFAIFFFDPVEALNDRVALLSTTLLTLVAFIFIMTQYLPPLPFLTIVDKYVCADMLYLLWVALHCVVQKGFAEPLQDADFSSDELNRALFYVDAGIFLLWHLGYVWICRAAFLAERKKLTDDADDKTMLQAAGVDEVMSLRRKPEECGRKLLKREEASVEI